MERTLRGRGGSGGAGALNESASLALEVLPRLTPGAFLVSFCAHKKKLAVRRNLTASFGKTKEMGSGKICFQRRSLWFFGYFLHEQKVARSQSRQGLITKYVGLSNILDGEVIRRTPAEGPHREVV